MLDILSLYVYCVYYNILLLIMINGVLIYYNKVSQNVI